MCEGRKWRDSRRRYDSRYPPGPGPLDENTAAAVDRSDGGYGFYGVDPRSLAAPGRGIEGSPSVNAAGNCAGKKVERSHRCEQDLRLPAV
jgi:hypothetical protein